MPKAKVQVDVYASLKDGKVEYIATHKSMDFLMAAYLPLATDVTIEVEVSANPTTEDFGSKLVESKLLERTTIIDEYEQCLQDIDAELDHLKQIYNSRS